MRYRDISKISQDNQSMNVQSFNSVDEIYYFMDHMFTEGFSEKHINIALDVFNRDAG